MKKRAPLELDKPLVQQALVAQGDSTIIIYYALVAILRPLSADGRTEEVVVASDSNWCTKRSDK